MASTYSAVDYYADETLRQRVADAWERTRSIEETANELGTSLHDAWVLVRCHNGWN